MPDDINAPTLPKKKSVRVFAAPREAAAFAAGGSPEFTATSVELALSDPPWAAAYEEFARRGGETYVEAQIPLEVPFERVTPVPSPQELALFGAPKCQFKPENPNAPMGGQPGWHLLDRFSQLASARAWARAHSTLGRPVRVASIDTGYDKDHKALPAHILRELSLDFTHDPPKKYADDPGPTGLPLDNRGHGTATVCILAGGPISLLGGQELGGAPDVEVLPLRISDSVVLVAIDALAHAVDYAVAQGCDVISLSMGGVASKFWLNAFNRAYEKGVVCVAAAGNHLRVGSAPLSPRSTVYPALFNRVIAATGVMADGRPYELSGMMSGNSGPHDKMRTALAANTPNIPWAEYGCAEIVSHDGAGTSSATPQIAAAAALWLQVHGNNYAKDWRRAEAVRQALFQSAKAQSEHYEKLGRGILQARAALDLVPQGLPKEASDVLFCPWLKVLTGLGVEEEGPSGALEEMLHVEFAQLTISDNNLAELVRGGLSQLDERQRQQVRAYIAEESALASPQLKQYVKDGTLSATPPAPRVRPAAAPGRLSDTRKPWTPPPPAVRRLRCYALDPSYEMRRATCEISQVTLEVPWEELKPGPIDEYLEVIDYDPASQCFYDPVDLNQPELLAQDGLAPSPGNPHFHQQMVYAVSRRTIDTFEKALGRKVFWTGPPLNREEGSDGAERRYRFSMNDRVFVPRLRIYPHAMRAENAYYSQRKGALLFGYFPSRDEDRLGNEGVYTCLSHDIIVHETTHAILDGMNRTLVQPTNPDVRAFHEAFADIVALLLRLQMKEVVLSQIRATRGDLTGASILGTLGQEFGRGRGQYQALRSYLGRYMEEFRPVTRREPVSRYATDEEIHEAYTEAQKNPTYQRVPVWQPPIADPRRLAKLEKPHERGSVLVAAVFEALVSIYQARAAKLLRVANAECGANCCVRPLQPELEELLAKELIKTAGQVLAICIRAIDYLPPTDITFGEYLRAILTADRDLVAADPYHYRVAFIESFRNWGIKTDTENTGEDSLVWQSFDPGSFAVECRELAARLGKFVEEDFRCTGDRGESFQVTNKWRWILFDWLKKKFKQRPGMEQMFGLDLRATDARFYVRGLRRVERVGPHGRVLPQALLQITQTKELERNGVETFVMGGATLIVNTVSPGIDYVILKKIHSKEREAAALDLAMSVAEDTLGATYFGADASLVEPFALMHQEEVQ